MHRFLLALTLGLSLGCAGIPTLADAQGPGNVFPTVDDAAVDALAFANERAHATRRVHRMHGGVILEVPGGYSYEHVDVAPADAPNELTLVLRANAVAHFRTYPRSRSFEVNQRNERFSEADLANVDHQDPHHRPAYVLTPSLVVRAYHGAQEGVRRVARVSPPSWRVLTARR